jgi:hypothetical protein
MILEPKLYEKPSEGIHDLQISEFVDKGTVTGKYGARERIQVVFEVLDEQGADGKNLKLFLNANQSLHKKSTFGTFLRDLGVDPANKAIDTDELVGTRFKAFVKHTRSETDGQIYANLGDIVKSRPRPTTTIVEQF